MAKKRFQIEKFTPGPWQVVIDDDGNPLSGRPSIVASDELDCGIVHPDGFVQTYWRSARGDKEIHANANLIAAAPEMYEALEATKRDFAKWAEIRGGVGTYRQAMARIDAALAKARGDQ